MNAVILDKVDIKYITQQIFKTKYRNNKVDFSSHWKQNECDSKYKRSKVSEWMFMLDVGEIG